MGGPGRIALSSIKEFKTLRQLLRVQLQAQKYAEAIVTTKKILTILKGLELSAPQEVKDVWRKTAESYRTLLEKLEKTPKQIAAIPGQEETPDGSIGAVDLPKDCAEMFSSASKSTLGFNDLAGLEQVKEDLKDSIELPLKYPDKWQKLGVKSISGLLLYGPPGCGKTYVAKCASGQFNIRLLVADPSVVMSKYVGESEKVVAKLFKCARKAAPAIVFVDEVDKLIPLESKGSEVPQRVEAQFLQEMSGIKPESNFIVVMATNEPWNLNPAIIRPGRIDRWVYVPEPDRETRQRIFELNLSGLTISGEVSYYKLAAMTEPTDTRCYAASDITAICEDIRLHIAKDWAETDILSPVTMQRVKDAMKKVRPSISKQQISRYIKWGKDPKATGRSV